MKLPKFIILITKILIMTIETKDQKSKEKKMIDSLVMIKIKNYKISKIIPIKQTVLCKNIYGNMLTKLMENYNLFLKKLWKILINMSLDNCLKIFNLKTQTTKKPIAITMKKEIHK